MKEIKNLGTDYYDHYEKFLGNPIDYIIFEDDKIPKKIQILVYDNVFDNCLVFASLGFSHYADSVGGEFAEIILAADEEFEAIPELLFNSIRSIILQKMDFSWGLSITGLEKINKDFFNRTNKNSLYFTLPLILPTEFSEIKSQNKFIMKKNLKPHAYMAFFISDLENNYFKKYGAEKFEDLLETNNVDPLEIYRSSVC